MFETAAGGKEKGTKLGFSLLLFFLFFFYNYNLK